MDPNSSIEIIDHLLTDIDWEVTPSTVSGISDFLESVDQLIVKSLHFSVNRALSSPRWAELMNDNVNLTSSLAILTQTQVVLWACKQEIQTLRCPEMFDDVHNECTRLISEIRSMMDTLEELGY